MSELSDELRELAAACGVATEYWDWQGAHVRQPAGTVVAVLRALGVDAADPRAALATRERARWERLLPPCVVTRQGRTARFEVHVDDGAAVAVWVELETGGRREVGQVDNWEPARQLGARLVGEASFELPAGLPLGYHRLHARSGTSAGAAPLIVTPDALPVPERRIWGLTTQLYSVRSERSWGVGDLADLADLAAWTARQGGGFVLVNPMHAAEPVPPLNPSPYLPTSRRFGNPLYVRPERIPEYADLADGARSQVLALRSGLASQLVADRVERDPAWLAKEAALRLVHAVPRGAGREIAYRNYRDREGAGLVDFATWCALTREYGPDWRAWPEPLRHPGDPAVAAFRAANAAEVDFQCWLQWVLEEQLDTTQAGARRDGASLGILHDLAVGVHASGADSWALQDVLAAGVRVGAPPDAFNQVGQDWQQPPWRPDRLAELGYAPFRDMVATLLRHSGGVRVDHVIGLFRLWWIPEGNAPGAGTYVAYDHEALIGILALEAFRSGALVIGEDLGVVEPSTRAYLRERGILGTSILWFERDYDGAGGPLPPGRWRDYCLASVTTHDLPPTAGYLAGDHIRLRHSLGLLTRPLAAELAVEEAERDSWLATLRSYGLLKPAADLEPDAGEERTIAALYRFLTLTPCRLLGVALTDLIGDRRTQNQPGTLEEYPNWRVPLSTPDGRPALLADVLGSDRATRLATVLATATAAAEVGDRTPG
jgi:4-alpha-glucanotransferase